ncbi:Dolichyl-phosphate-mannose-protein mannosyltransferase [Acidovorax soli]|uniref:Dolichyl-phosphate-mannose-protein mannosyltransferase n=1 Tax=Acidovorax soli TaxID=592050 RepID=A0A1H4DZ26_9BURK|nr:Dolichyl-phosphate-mannose-protein mannosyltransferase [Acidovorax soli]
MLLKVNQPDDRDARAAIGLLHGVRDSLQIFINIYKQAKYRVVPQLAGLPVSSSTLVSSPSTVPVPAAQVWALRFPVLDGAGVALLMAVYGAVWVTAYWMATLSPPVDNVEQLVWLRSLEWGYFKHPPLPTWVLGATAAIFGATVELTYVMGALFTLGALALFWRQLRAMRGGRYATLALLAALCITFYCGRVYYYNHNVVMMLWVSLAAGLSWRLTWRPSLLGWVAMGVVAGLGMLAKYQFIVALAVVGIWWLRLRGWRHLVHRVGAPLAAAVALLVCAPHLHWLATHDWMPLGYANASSLGHDLSLPHRLLHTAQFSADWLLNRALPAWLVLGCAVWWARRQGEAPQRGEEAAPGAGYAQLSRQFLLLWGFLPLALMALMGVVGGAKLHLHWGTAFMLWSVPAVMEWLAARAAWTSLRTVRAAWAGFAVVQALLMAQSWMALPRGPRGYKSDHTDYFPSERVADIIARQAHAVLGGPIDIVSGQQALAGAVAVRLAERPRVLILGELKYSPWIQPEELETARVIEVFSAPGKLPLGAYRAVGQLAWRPGVSALSMRDQGDWLRASQEEAVDEPEGLDASDRR